MDPLFDESREGKLIDDYLFGNYKQTSKLTFGLDQQFAKPIEDEDLFGIGLEDAQMGMVNDNDILEEVTSKDGSNHLDFEDDEEANPFGALDSAILSNRNSNSPGNIFEDDEIIQMTHLDSNKRKDEPKVADIDEIFIDDYSMTSDNGKQQDVESNNENFKPNGLKTFSKHKGTPPMSPSRVKSRQVKENIVQQVKAMLVRPKKLSSYDESSAIEMTVEEGKSDFRTKVMFNKMFNNSKKAKDVHDSPISAKTSWDKYSESLRCRLSSQKRKTWEALQQPADVFDEEEELIEAPLHDSKQDHEEEVINSESDESEDEDHVRKKALKSAGHKEEEDEEEEEKDNFEDLEREEVGSDGQSGDSLSCDELATSDKESRREEESDNEDIEDEDIISDAESAKDEEQKLITSDDDSEDESDCSQKFSLNIDDEESTGSKDKIANKKRRIFIDDEASED